MTDPQPLSDADLLAWSVVLAYRGLQQKRGITILLLPFPPCPICGGVVHGADSATVERGIHQTATLTLRPCGHVHAASDDGLYRVHEHVGDMLDAMEDADNGRRQHDSWPPKDRPFRTEDVIREARARTTAPPEPPGAPRRAPGASGGELAGQNGDRGSQAASGGSGWTQLEARAFNAVLPALREAGEWLPLSARRAVARAVLAATQAQVDLEEFEYGCPDCSQPITVGKRAEHRCDEPEQSPRTTVNNPSASGDTARDVLRDEIVKAVTEEMHSGEGPSGSIPRIADAILAVRDREMEQLRAKITEIDHIINWHTTCASCARILDSSYRETVRAETAEQQRDQLAALVRDFRDPDPCQLDHHGYCQAHSWMCSGSQCPHARAREVLTELDQPKEQP